MNIGIVGIHTNIGKTICSSILCQALEMSYFKPIQAGDIDNSDSKVVHRLTNGIDVFNEAYIFNTAQSIHFASKIDNLSVDLNSIQLPLTNNGIIIETAGGLFSPINQNLTNIDLIKHFNVPVIIVSKHYLGSINHTLMTIEICKANNINILGIVFNGLDSYDSEKFILGYSQIPKLFTFPFFDPLNDNILKEFLLKESIIFQKIKNDFKVY